MELLIRIELDDALTDALELRWALEDAIEHLGLGEVLDAGVGVDTMEVYVEIDDRDVEATTRALAPVLDELGLTDRATIRALESAPPPVLPPWAPGTCLSVRVDDDDTADDDAEARYGAVVVLARDEEGVLVGVLRYLSSRVPSAEVFERREWLVLDHHGWDNETEVFWCYGDTTTDFTAGVEQVGETALRDTDPSTASSWRRAEGLASQAAHQAAWDAVRGKAWDGDPN